MRQRILSFLTLALLMTMPLRVAHALGPGDTLLFADGAITCEIGGTPPNNCDLGLTQVTGSYFAIDFNANGIIEDIEKTPVSTFQGIILGSTQPAFGSHSGCTFGTETPSIDQPWCFFANTGMFQTTGTPVTVTQDNGTHKLLDFGGFGVTWNGIPNIPLGGDPANFPGDTGLATLTCNPADCSDLTHFTLDYSAHVPIGDPSGFGGVHFVYHLESPASVPLSFAISVTGGTSQECATIGGTPVTATASTTLPNGDSIASISWTLNGVVVGTGESLDAFLELGTNTITASLLTTLGQTASDSLTVIIHDTTDPVVTAGFFDRKTGAPLAQTDKTEKVVVRYSAEDVCDIDPSVKATLGTAVQDGQTIKVSEDGKLVITGVSSLDLVVTAQDASGNVTIESATLIVKP